MSTDGIRQLDTLISYIVLFLPSDRSNTIVRKLFSTAEEYFAQIFWDSYYNGSNVNFEDSPQTARRHIG